MLDGEETPDFPIGLEVRCGEETPRFMRWPSWEVVVVDLRVSRQVAKSPNADSLALSPRSWLLPARLRQFMLADSSAHPHAGHLSMRDYNSLNSARHESNVNGPDSWQRVCPCSSYYTSYRRLWKMEWKRPRHVGTYLRQGKSVFTIAFVYACFTPETHQCRNEWTNRHRAMFGISSWKRGKSELTDGESLRQSDSSAFRGPWRPHQPMFNN